MIEENPETLSIKQQYKLMIGTVIPRPIAFITTLSDNDRLNLAPFSFYNVVAKDPPLLSVSFLRDEEGQMKDTARNLLERGEGVVHSVSKSMIDQVNLTAAPLDYGESELQVTDFTLVDSVKVSTPGLAEAHVRFEVQVYDHLPVKNEEGQVISDLILLRIVYNHLSSEVYQDTYVLPEVLEPMSRLAGNDYAELGDLQTLIRPSGKEFPFDETSI